VCYGGCTCKGKHTVDKQSDAAQLLRSHVPVRRASQSEQWVGRSDEAMQPTCIAREKWQDWRQDTTQDTDLFPLLHFSGVSCAQARISARWVRWDRWCKDSYTSTSNASNLCSWCTYLIRDHPIHRPGTRRRQA